MVLFRWVDGTPARSLFWGNSQPDGDDDDCAAIELGGKKDISSPSERDRR